MPLKDSTETKMGCQERRRGRMLELGALLGFPHLPGSLPEDQLALANSLMHYLPSTLLSEIQNLMLKSMEVRVLFKTYIILRMLTSNSIKGLGSHRY
ncbi:hypothetical protein Patl1_29190 [Pistacia atlantica]|uniref:Uncharacterized protein n=1 Tax=Pistacia atlantica TaxID=434234 RepID=A0ACC1BEX7_9ROSI|nr:hypothetical protein Patl1_29190 [Pistacia atlantica]